MNVHEVSYDQLIAFAAGELKEDERNSVADHIQSCAACALTVTRYQHLRTFLPSDDSQAPPAHTLTRAIALLPKAEPAPTPPLWSWTSLRDLPWRLIGRLHPVAYEQLIAFAAGELDERSAARVRLHIGQCAQCAETLARFRSVGFLLRTNGQPPPPPETLARAFAIYQPPPLAAASVHVPARRAAFGHWPLAGARLGMLMLALAACVVFGGVGVSVASAATLPGDSLYDVKRWREDTQLAIVSDPAQLTQLRLAYAQERAREIEGLLTAQRMQAVPATAAAYQMQVEKAQQDFLQVAQRDPQRALALAPEVQNSLARSQASLQQSLARAPLALQPSIQQAATSAARTQGAVQVQVVGTPTPTATATTTPTHTPSPSATASTTATRTPSATPTSTPSATPLPPTATPTEKMPPTPTVAAPLPPISVPTIAAQPTAPPKNTPAPTEEAKPTKPPKPTDEPKPPKPTEEPKPTKPPKDKEQEKEERPDNSGRQDDKQKDDKQDKGGRPDEQHNDGKQNQGKDRAEQNSKGSPHRSK